MHETVFTHVAPLLAAQEWVGLAKGGLWLALILVMLAAALKMAKEYRRRGSSLMGIFSGNDADGSQDAHQTLTKFRELHARGGLSDDEYRTIKTKLASELQAEAKPSTPPPGSPTTPPNSGPSTADAEGPVFESIDELNPVDQVADG